MHVTPFSTLRPSPRRGFTLVEIMVVVIIIAILAALAFPMIGMSKTNARSATFINDLRQARSVFETYALESGVYPPDSTPGVVPPPMTNELAGVHWTEPTAIGGQWDWDYNTFGVTAGVSVFGPDLSDAQMAKIDARIDDGNLATGSFRQRSGGFIYILEL